MKEYYYKSNREAAQAARKAVAKHSLDAVHHERHIYTINIVGRVIEFDAMTGQKRGVWKGEQKSSWGTYLNEFNFYDEMKAAGLSEVTV